MFVCFLFGLIILLRGRSSRNKKLKKKKKKRKRKERGKKLSRHNLFSHVYVGLHWPIWWVKGLPLIKGEIWENFFFFAFCFDSLLLTVEPSKPSQAFPLLNYCNSPVPVGVKHHSQTPICKLTHWTTWWTGLHNFKPIFWHEPLPRTSTPKSIITHEGLLTCEGNFLFQTTLFSLPSTSINTCLNSCWEHLIFILSFLS